MADGRDDDWVVVIPVKHLSAAKTRMGAAGVPAVDALALAFFQDTAAAATSCPSVHRVIVATSDPRVSEWAISAGCEVFDDSGHAGINAAAMAAAGEAESARLAVLVSDLPCATAGSLAHALDLAGSHPRAFLSDAAGTGTTMWTRLPGQPTDPRFGQDSSAAHRDAGAADIARAMTPLPSGPTNERMRRDVDTPADLADALRVGVGEHTAAALAGMDVV